MAKRFFSVILAMVMCCSFSATAFAAVPEKEHPVSFQEQGEVVTLDSNGEAMIEVPAKLLAGSDSIPFGGGTETWSTTGKTVTVGTFTMTGNNLTPVKTIGVSGYNIGITTKFSANKSVRVTTEIQKAYSSTVLADGVSSVSRSGSYSTGLAYVNKGDKIQIYFRVTDTNGKYDDNLPCTITYSYTYVRKF